MHKAARSLRRRSRSGTALVEFALCLPVIALISFATIEACSMIFLQQSLEVIAYEGARTAIMPTTDESNVRGVCQLILDDRGIRDATITITPADFDQQPTGTYVAVDVTIPCNTNSYLGAWFYGGRSLTGHVEMMREMDQAMLSLPTPPVNDGGDDDDDDDDDD